MTDTAELCRLDTEIRVVLTAMLVISYGSVQSWNASGRNGERDPRPPGEAHPMHEHWAAAYRAALGMQSKRRVIREARDALQEWQGRTLRVRIEVTVKQEEQWILGDGEGHDPQAVAIKFRTSATRVRRLRVANARHPETGKPLDGAPVTPAADLDRVRRLKADGCSLRQIETLTGMKKDTVARLLKRAA